MPLGSVLFKNGQRDEIDYWEVWQHIPTGQNYLFYTTAYKHERKTANAADVASIPPVAPAAASPYAANLDNNWINRKLSKLE